MLPFTMLAKFPKKLLPLKAHMGNLLLRHVSFAGESALKGRIKALRPPGQSRRPRGGGCAGGRDGRRQWRRKTVLPQGGNYGDVTQRRMLNCIGTYTAQGTRGNFYSVRTGACCKGSWGASRPVRGEPEREADTVQETQLMQGGDFLC